MSDAFTDYKGVIKFLNPAINTPCRVEVPIKITPLPKMGRASQQKKCFQQASEDYEENFFLEESKRKSTKG
jgi:hypothetical protein